MINVNLYAEIVSHQQNGTKVLLFENEHTSSLRIAARLKTCHLKN